MAKRKRVAKKTTSKALCMDYKKLRAIENEIRDLKNWVAVFANEYDMPKEVVNKLQARLQRLAKDIANVRM